MSEIPSFLQINCSCFVYHSLIQAMMTCNAAVSQNLQLTSSETTGELLCRAFDFSTAKLDSLSRTCNNNHAPANANN